MESLQRSLLIIYHHPCFDGALSAVNVYQYYTILSNKGYKITFHPLKNGEWIDVDDIGLYDKIVIVDVDIGDKGFELLLNIDKDKNKDRDKVYRSILIFDHHLTFINKFNKDIMPLFINEGYNCIESRKTIKIVFNESNTQSGCGLTYRYYKAKAIKKANCYTNTVFNDNLELINNYVEDSDTGQCILPHTEEFKSGLCTEFHQKAHQFDFTNPKTAKYLINNILNINVKFTIASGEKSLRNYKKKAHSDLLREKTFVFKLEFNKETHWTFLIQITQHKQYRNCNGPILATISHMNGYSPIGGYLYYDDYGVCKHKHILI